MSDLLTALRSYPVAAGETSRYTASLALTTEETCQRIRDAFATSGGRKYAAKLRQTREQELDHADR